MNDFWDDVQHRARRHNIPFAGHTLIRWILIRLRCGRYRSPGRLVRRLNPRDIPRVVHQLSRPGAPRVLASLGSQSIALQPHRAVLGHRAEAGGGRHAAAARPASEGVASANHAFVAAPMLFRSLVHDINSFTGRQRPDAGEP
jgi:hypothetical protein